KIVPVKNLRNIETVRLELGAVADQHMNISLPGPFPKQLDFLDDPKNSLWRIPRRQSLGRVGLEQGSPRSEIEATILHLERRGAQHKLRLSHKSTPTVQVKSLLSRPA